jgi:hypothetical protein
MRHRPNHLTRRNFVKAAGCTLYACSTGPAGSAQETAAASLFDGKTLDGWIQLEKNPPPPGSSSAGWVVKDGVMASTGLGRGVIYTAQDYGQFRLLFSMRHVSGNPDHQACILIFCTRPQPDEKPLDALGGIQFQVPNGGHWDYRPGKNNNGGEEFNRLTNPQFDPHAWSRVEILADSSKGSARVAVAQPAGSKAVEVLDFHDPAAGKIGPIAWQMHNPGLFDEYKDITIELNPKEDRLTILG